MPREFARARALHSASFPLVLLSTRGYKSERNKSLAAERRMIKIHLYPDDDLEHHQAHYNLVIPYLFVASLSSPLVSRKVLYSAASFGISLPGEGRRASM